MNKIYILLILIFTFSCQNKKAKEIETVLNEMKGETIRFPNILKATLMGEDTLCPDILKKENRIVVYFDSTGCTECKMKLNEWTTIIRFAKDSVSNLSFLFIMSPQKDKSLSVRSILKRHEFNYPVFIDSLNQFEVLNKLNRDSRFHTFLIDKHNEIVLVGSPIGNEKMWKLYKNYVKKRIKKSSATSEVDHEYISSRKETQIKILKDSVNLGRFSFQSIKHVSFQLKNNGKQPLIIQSVNTSCGCTVAKNDKKPIPQGETTTVILEFKPNLLGYFSKTADVICNVPEGYVRLKISGEVVKDE